MEFQSFRIGFDLRDKKRVYESWDEIFASQKWAEGKFTSLFEEKWAKWNGLPSVATSSWTGAAMACLEYFGIRGRKVLCPTNTFMATPWSVVQAGGEVVFGDCNRSDLCLNLDAVVDAAAQHDLILEPLHGRVRDEQDATVRITHDPGDGILCHE